jgi:GNAT superfamily N-acetyltransferase
MGAMGWTLTTDLDAFLAAAGPFLHARPVENSVPLTILDTLRRRGPDAYGPQPPLFGHWQGLGAVGGAGATGGAGFGEGMPAAGAAASVPGEDVAAAVLQTPPFPPLLTAAPRAAAVALPDVWGEAVEAGRAPVPGGVRGEAAAARAFAAGWQRRTGAGLVPRRDTRVHRLAALTPREPAPPGAARVAGPADRTLLLRWQAAFAADVGADVPGGDRAVDDAVAHGLRTLWELPDGRPVAMAGVTLPAAGAVRVAAVYTPPEHRGRGYAGAAVAAVSRAALDAGAREVLLVTDLADPVSNGLYRALGYVPVADTVELDFTPAP